MTPRAAVAAFLTRGARIDPRGGCVEVDIDGHWWFAFNPGDHAQYCSAGPLVGPGDCYIERDGRPADRLPEDHGAGADAFYAGESPGADAFMRAISGLAPAAELQAALDRLAAERDARMSAARRALPPDRPRGTPTPAEAIIAYAERVAMLGIKDLPGCWEVDVDGRWWFAVNGHPEPIACSRNASVPPYSAYVEYQGWPAGTFGMDGAGMFAAGTVVNQAAFAKALAVKGGTDDT